MEVRPAAGWMLAVQEEIPQERASGIALATSVETALQEVVMARVVETGEGVKIGVGSFVLVQQRDVNGFVMEGERYGLLRQESVLAEVERGKG